MRFALCLALTLLSVLILGQGCPPSPHNPPGGGADMTAPATLGGTVNARNFTIPAGHITTVTGDLHVTATGNVLIDGELVAADAEEGAGSGITIDADGDVDVSGHIKAGNAAPPVVSSVFSIKQDEPPDERNPLDGDYGGVIEMKSKGNLTLRRSARIEAGDGTDGLDGSHGGRGGSGGSIFLIAGNKLTIYASLHIGNGGNGGDAQTSPDNLPDGGRFNNDGGRSGYFFVKHGGALAMPGAQFGDVTGVDPVAYTMNTPGNTISGGLGGSAGTVMITDIDQAPVSATVPQSRTLQSRTVAQATDDCPTGEHCVYAGSGGYGWYSGGFGGTAAVALGFTFDGYNGSSWNVYGGNGGYVSEESALAEMTLGPGGESIIAVNAFAGFGGMVSLVTPPGQLGDSGHPNGGNGGQATGYGGKGGEASRFLHQTGGNGGEALVRAGVGVWGNDDACAPGSGGNGGDAYAFGGDGGNGMDPGQPGTATAFAGEGGPGGNGGELGGGAGGAGGLAHTEDGCQGADEPGISVGICGLIHEEYAAAGEPGQAYIYCCVCP
jgi:hypothetical protein